MSLIEAGPRPFIGDVVGTGLVALDRIHVSGRGQVLEELGGSCGNVLICLAELGRGVAPLLRLGDDAVGDRLVAEFAGAGADISLISRSGTAGTPVILELLDPASAAHTFSSTCPHTNQRLGAFEPIDPRDLDHARARLSTCSVLYVDRLSEAICEAMETASEAGAVVHFEPSRIAEGPLFDRALSAAHLVKYSNDRLPLEMVCRLRPSAFGIVTAGELGLQLVHDGAVQTLPAAEAERMIDTCGSGDMVTLGILDAILTSDVPRGTPPSSGTVTSGARAGQRVAAANCGFIGARGLFRERGPAAVRAILDAG